MKVSLFEVYSSTVIMNKLIEAPLQARLSFKLIKVVQKFNEELKQLDEQRVKLIRKYGTETAEGISVSDENKQSFIAEFNDLLAVEIDIDWDKISADALENITFSTADIMKIQYLFKE